MRLLSLLVFGLAILAPCFGQTAKTTPPEPPKDPRQILEAAGPFYDFNDAALKPWHLKATYQIYDLKGNPAEQGTWEYWWASPKLSRTSWTRADAARTEWTSAGGFYRKESGAPLHYFEKSLGSILLSPLPPRDVVASERMKLEFKPLPAGSPNLTCVSAEFQREHDGKLVLRGPAAEDYYCFDPSTLALRLDESHSIRKEFSRIVKMQGRYLARQIEVLVGKQRVFSLAVDAIDGVTAPDAEFSPPADAHLAQPAVSQSAADGADRGVATGSLVKKSPPVYPLMAKSEGIQGVVILGATIRTDGRVHDLEVIASPSPLLTGASIDCVKRWEYKPYLLNGVPVEVDTVVQVVFTLGS
jgi:TonB family protein